MTFDRSASPVAVRRLRAVLALRDQSIIGLARRLAVSDCHLRAVVLGARQPSSRLRDALVAELGEGPWAFVCGAVDVLSAKG
ncbi:MAG TPA: hypothetical protein VH877_29370 [Polyangia bacterium]|jgi:hypothetical protein|nr:hypothetical protein [Polyangia bacterium]